MEVKFKMANNQELLDDSNLEVPRGFLISLDEKGNYVPFLIKVRDKEIIWSGSRDTDFYNKLHEFMDMTGASDGDGMIGVPSKRFYQPNEKLVIRISSNIPTAIALNEDYERFEIEPNRHFSGVLRTNIFKEENCRMGYLFGTSAYIYTIDFPLPFLCETRNLSIVSDTSHTGIPDELSNKPLFTRTYTRNSSSDSLSYANHIVSEVYSPTKLDSYTESFTAFIDGNIAPL